MKKALFIGVGLVVALSLATSGFAQVDQAELFQNSRLNANQRVEAIKEKIAVRKAVIREGLCRRRQSKLDRAIDRLHTRSGHLKTVIDTMYARVKGFHEDGQLTVANYDQLAAAVEAAGADADAAISVVETFTFTVDCQNSKLGEQLDGFRTAIAETKLALKEYRRALVDLIKAMNKSKKLESNSQQSNDSLETETENESDDNSEVSQ